MRFCLLITLIFLFKADWSLGQNVFMEAKTGYGFNFQTERKNYNSPAGYIPVNVSVGGGFKKFQIGVDYIFMPLKPSRFYKDKISGQNRVREETSETYIGGFLRLNTSNKPEVNAGYILRVGGGYLQADKQVYNLPEDTKHETIKYEPSYQLNAETGVNIPIAQRVQLYLGTAIRYANLEIKTNGVTTEDYKKFNWLAHLGVTYNIQFSK